MIIAEHLYTTKSGTTLKVRTADDNDAAALLALKKSYLINCPTIPLYDYEYNNTIDQEAELINNYNKSENSILLVAEYDGNLIGNIDITGNKRKKLYHTAMLGMGIATNWQGKGIGTCLMDGALTALNRTVVSILWLEVYATNTAGLQLYEKSGFKVCGVIKNFFNEDGEETIDKVTMVKYIKE